MKPSRLATALVTSACVFASCKEESKPASQGGGARPAHDANTSPAKEPPKPAPQPAAPADPPPVKPPPAVPTTAPTGGSAPAASGAGHAVTPIDEATKKWFISVERAKELYDKGIDLSREAGIVTYGGVFQADMKVSLTNDGPVTFVLKT